MRRRTFLEASAGGMLASLASSRLGFGEDKDHDHAHEKHLRTYATPQEAMQSPRETLAYVPAIYVNTATKKADYLATIDIDPKSKTYCRVIHRTPMSSPGDELHHFGWNACSSCHADASLMRRYLVVPGLGSSRIHILDTDDPESPKLHKVIDGDTIKKKTNLSAPHTVHCIPTGEIMLSMLGDGEGNGPGGFLLLDLDFNILGHWEKSREGMQYNYDFWYQPRHNVMVSSEWAAPKTVSQGFKPADVEAGKYGRHIHFWDWETRKIAQSVDLGDEGLIPLEVRFHHDPKSTHGFVGAALGSSIWHWHKGDDQWKVEKVIQVEPVEVSGKSSPLPGLVTDILLSMDDKFLYFANWLHGDIRQYDVSDPAKPKLTGRVWLGGLLGRAGQGEGEATKGATVRGHELEGGPQMLQLSLDGKRLYVTNSLYSPWDDQFYPNIGKKGSYMLQLDCDTERGGLTLNEDFYVDFGAEPDGPARAHEIRFPNGDCTSDIWV